MSFKSPRRILPRASGGRYRVPMGTAAMDDLEHAIRAEARRFNVSCSFVIHTAVAYALGINSDDYHAVDAPPRKRAGRVIAMPHGRRRAS